jgi:putative ABC transport system permease protein
VVQKDTLGPYAESSSIHDDVYRSVLGMPGVAQAANVTYLPLQVSKGGTDVRAMVVGLEPDQPGEPGYLVAGRRVIRSRYEAVADVKSGFALGDRISIRHHDYRVVGLTRRMVSSGSDPMVFIPLKDAQEAQFLKDNDAIVNERIRTAVNPALNRTGVPGLLDAINASQTSNHNVKALLVRLAESRSAEMVGRDIHRWKHLQAFDREQMEEILVVKLIGTHNRTIAGMILQQALGLGLIGFAVGKIAATVRGRAFPRYVLLEPGDALRGFVLVMLVCTLASTLAIRAALKVDPATAIGG